MSLSHSAAAAAVMSATAVASAFAPSAIASERHVARFLRGVPQQLSLVPDENPGPVMPRSTRDYRAILGGIPAFDRDERFLVNILSAAMLAVVYRSLREKPDLRVVTAYYREAMSGCALMMAILKRRDAYSPKARAKLIRQAEASQGRTNPYTWKYRFDGGDNMIRRYLKNARKPDGIPGWFMLRGMNGGHTPISTWGLSLVHPAQDARALDIGCGGGANITRLMRMCPRGFVDGIDYSAESVRFSRAKNAAELGKRCEIRQGDAGTLPYGDGMFDLVTAFETVYFWSDLPKALAGVYRALKSGGQLLIVNAAEDPADTTWTDRIDGMRIYTGEDLKLRLQRAGFGRVSLSKHPKGWIGVLATKE